MTVFDTTQKTDSRYVSLVYEGTCISAKNEMLSLTDMWRADGADPSKRPVEWLRSKGARAFIDVLQEMVGKSHLFQTGTGRSAATMAHWQIAMAYAKYLSPEFHMWCNTVVRAHMEGRIVDQPREVISIEMLREAVRQEVMAARQELGQAWAYDLARSFLASQTLMIRKGKTAGTLWREFGFPPVKGIAAWFGNRLRDLGCAMEHSARAEMGTTTARLFDPDKARAWVENGGRFVIERRIAERRGQGVLSFVRKPTDEPRPL